MKIEVKVKAGSKKDLLSPAKNSANPNSFTAELKAPAHEGKANAALIKLLAKHFGVPQKVVFIRRGATSRNKLIEIVTN